MLGDPRQNARWQHAIFVKVNNKTTAVSHLKRPRKPQRGAGGRRGQERVCCKHPPSLGTLISGSPSANCPAPQTFLEEEVKRWGDPAPTRLRHLLLGAPGLAWLISTARHPALSVPLQTVPATLVPSYPAVFLMGATGDTPSHPFPPLGSVLNITQVAAPKSSSLPMHLHRAAHRASLSPTLGQSLGHPHALESISMHKARATSNTWPRLQVWGEPLMGNGLVSQASVTSVRSFCDSLKRETLAPTPGQGQAPATLARVGVGFHGLGLAG